MTLELSANDAQALYLGHLWGLISREQIVKTAENIIERSIEVPSAKICELALSVSKQQIETRLKKFITGADKWEAVRFLIRKYIKLGELNEVQLTTLYYSIGNYADWDDENPWREIKILTHELSDAKRGIYGDEKLIAKEIREKILTQL